MIELMTVTTEPVVNLSTQTRVIAAFIAIGFMVFILELIRRDRLQERYTVIWFIAALALLIGAALPGTLEFIASVLGVRDTNVALFSLLILFLLALAINFSVIISSQAKQITRLTQESALRDAELQYESGDEAERNETDRDRSAQEPLEPEAEGL